jgi:hypothetical protein
MWKNGLLVLFVLCLGILSKAQTVSSISFSDNSDFDKIRFSLNATEGQCSIEPAVETSVMNIQNLSKDSGNPEFEEKIVERTREINVKLDDQKSISLSSTISKRMFSRQAVDDYVWKVYLADIKPMDLDLSYAVGDTYIDLSGLPVEKFKMNTGSANVKVNYKSNSGNLIQMDTFLVKVDMGTLSAKNLHLSRSGHVIADVGFGSVYMDFKEAKNISTAVVATVGAGKLEVILPSGNIPVKININDSPLCRVKMPSGFTKSKNNEFTNQAFETHNGNYLTFNVDVAVGNIVFKSSSL